MKDTSTYLNKIEIYLLHKYVLQQLKNIPVNKHNCIKIYEIFAKAWLSWSADFVYLYRDVTMTHSLHSSISYLKIRWFTEMNLTLLILQFEVVKDLITQHFFAFNTVVIIFWHRSLTADTLYKVKSTSSMTLKI